MKFALKFISRFKILLIVLVIFVALDLVSKWYVFEKILGITSQDIHTAVKDANEAVEKDESGETPFQPNRYLKIHRVELIEEHVYFSSVLNPGAFSGMLGGNRPALITLSIIAVLVLLIIFFKATKITFITQVLGGTIFAGALGNFYDRVVFRVVRDFVDCRIPELPEIKFFNPWNTFNLADAFISVGVITFMVILIFTKSDKQKNDQSKDKFEITDSKQTNAKYFVVFPENVNLDTSEFADELSKIVNMHPIDARRLCRKQEGFFDRPFVHEEAIKIKEYFETKIQGVQVIHINDFPRISKFKDITNFEGLENGLLIDRQKSLDLEPIPWDKVSLITLGIVAEKLDPVTKHINETLDNAKIFNNRDLTRDEKNKVLSSLLQDFDKIELWNKFLDEQIQIMNAEELKESSKKMPIAIVSIFCADGRNYRLSSNSMILSNLPESRTPNDLANIQIMLNQVVKIADPGKISETAQAFVRKVETSEGKSEFKAQIIENMAFASIHEYENYLRWYVNIKDPSLKISADVRDSAIKLVEIDTSLPVDEADEEQILEPEILENPDPKTEE